MLKPLLALLLALSATIAARAQPVPPEVHPGHLVEQVELRATDGTRLRAIVTRPADARGRLPAVLFVGWLSCSTVALPPTPRDGWDAMLTGLIRGSGALVWRTEKRGVGGSEGSCAGLDYATELADHAAALDALRRRPDVDPARIVLFGASMGATMAPLLAAEAPVAGVAIWGGGARTWAERTITFERNRVELGASPAAGRAAAMSARVRFIAKFLIEGATPMAIAAAHPELSGVWSDMAATSATGMYGRPFAFHWQAQREDWAGAWARVAAPVLAMAGEHDWFEDPGGIAFVADIVNRAAPGRARFALVPGLDHHFSCYPTARAAFAGDQGMPDADATLRVLLPWLAEQLGETR